MGFVNADSSAVPPAGLRVAPSPGPPAADGAFLGALVPAGKGDENEKDKSLRENKLRGVPAGSSEVFCIVHVPKR